MPSRALRKNISDTAGYTLDQTILIIAIIAILVTLIILTIGWTFLNKAAGTRLASQLGDMKDALSSYYGDVKQWPQGTSSSPTLDAAALAGFNDKNGSTKNYISGLLASASGVQHNLNAMANRNVLIGLTSGNAGNWPGPVGSLYEVVEFQNIAGSDFAAADAAIDSSDGGELGKVRIIAAAGSAPAAGAGCFAASPSFISATVANVYYDVCYISNNAQ